jgi:hypothetical protein
MNPGAFPEVIVDIVVSSNEDDDATYLPEPDALGDRDVLVVDDAGGVGTTSAEATIPDPIRVGAPGTIMPSIDDRVTTVPPSGARRQKRMCLAMKWSDPVPLVDQVMYQVELLPYHVPRNPVDLVPSEIISGCMFDSFHRV